MDGLSADLRRLAGSEAVELGLRAVHLETGAAVEIAPDLVLPTASTFKTPLAVEVFRQAEARRLRLDERMRLEDRHRTLTSGVLQALASGLEPTIRDLVVLATVISDNTATEMLVERIGGADAFNAALQAMGAASTHYAFGAHGMFTRGFGTPPDASLEDLEQAATTRAWDYGSDAFARDSRNTVSTARDLCGLMARLGRGAAGLDEAPLLSQVSCHDLLSIMARQQHTDRIPRHLPYGAVFNKTGGLGGVRSDIGLIRRPGRGHVAYAMLTFDPTPLPPGRSDAMLERIDRMNRLFGEVGLRLWNGFNAAEAAA